MRKLDQGNSRFRGLIASASLKPWRGYLGPPWSPGQIPRLDCLGLIEARYPPMVQPTEAHDSEA